jgi:hypothetical protein
MDLADAALAGTALVGFGGKALAFCSKVIIGSPTPLNWAINVMLVVGTALLLAG